MATVQELETREATLRKEAETIGKSDFAAGVAKWNEAEAVAKEIVKARKVAETEAFEAQKAERLEASEAAHKFMTDHAGDFKAAVPFGLHSVRVTPTDDGPKVTWSFKVPEAITKGIEKAALDIFNSKAVQGTTTYKMRYIEYAVGEAGNLMPSVGFTAPSTAKGKGAGSGGSRGGRVKFSVNGQTVEGHRGLAALAGKESEFDAADKNKRYQMGVALEKQLKATRLPKDA